MKKILRIILGKKYSELVKIYWFIVALIYPILIKRKGTLVYAGINVGDSFQKIFFKYDRVIGFEPNPKNFEKLNRFNKYKYVEIYNYALGEKKGKVKMYLPDNLNNDASASLSNFSRQSDVQSIATCEVDCIILSDFLIKKKIKNIDFFLCDTEGYDLTILKTMKKEFIDKKRIKILQVEAENNNRESRYSDVTNYEYEFDTILSENYIKLGRGSGLVKRGDDFSGWTLDLLYTIKN
jgi:FkbM family methyltransferase